MASAREVLCTSHFFAIALHDLHVVAAHDIPEGLVLNVRSRMQQTYLDVASVYIYIYFTV